MVLQHARETVIHCIPRMRIQYAGECTTQIFTPTHPQQTSLKAPNSRQCAAVTFFASVDYPARFTGDVFATIKRRTRSASRLSHDPQATG